MFPSLQWETWCDLVYLSKLSSGCYNYTEGKKIKFKTSHRHTSHSKFPRLQISTGDKTVPT